MAMFASLDGREQSLRGPVPAVGLEQMLDGDARRDLASEMTPHPVGHRCQVARRQSEVLVGGT